MTATQAPAELKDFENLIGETFVFSLEGVEGTAEGVLVKVEELATGKAPGAEREPFVLEFKFPPNANYGQCLYQVKTRAGEPMPSMFLVPRGNDESGWYMDSIFN